mgnify:CR=1 FL=1
MDYGDASDKWYKYKGVKPPERTTHGVTEDTVENVIRANANHVCDWRQKGNYIFCRAGEYEHGHNIGVSKRLTGTENGKPVLQSI